MRSQRQWRFLFASGKPFARRWAHETPGGQGTRYRRLPDTATKDSGVAGLAVPPHGPQALANQPGQGQAARGSHPLLRRFQKRHKATGYGARAGQQIRGRLYRGGDGKFTSGGGGGASGPPDRLSRASTPDAVRAPKRASAPKGRGRGRSGGAARKPTLTPEQRRAQRAQEREQAAQQRYQETAAAVAQSGGVSTQDLGALSEFASGTDLSPDAAARLESAGLLERGSDGTTRLSAAGNRLSAALDRGDVRGALDALSVGRDRAAKLAQPKKGGGGGGGKKPKPTDAERAAAADAKKRQTAAQTAPAVGLSPAEVDFLRGAASGNLPPGSFNAKHLMDLGLVADTGDTTEATDQGRRALAALERGNVIQYQAAVQDAKARMGREADAAKRRSAAQAAAQQRQAERDQRQAERDAKTKRQLQILRQRARGGGKLTPTERDRLTEAGYGEYSPDGRTWRVKAVPQPTRVLDGGHTGVMIALMVPAAVAKQIAALPGVTEPAEQMHVTLAFLGDSTEAPLATNKARLLDAIRQWATEHGTPLKGTINGVGRFLNAESDGTNAVYVSPDLAGLPAMRQSLVQWIKRSGFDYAQNHGFTPHITVAYVPEGKPTPSIQPPPMSVRFTTVTVAWGDEHYDFPLGPTSAFRVFKDAAGRDRWLAISSTAYRDRDQEIVSTTALRAAVGSADAAGATNRGPLRYWHVKGLDLGDCDYQAVSADGRFLFESGTFRSPRAVAMGHKAARDGWQMSIGFVHPTAEPDAAGVFRHIAIFERSLVPPGRAANPFTAFTTTKETRMLTEEKRKAFLDLAGGADGAELLDALLASAQQTATKADAAGVAYKDDSAPPAWAQTLIAQVDALSTTVKSLTATEKADTPAEMVEAGDTEAADGEADMLDAGDDGEHPDGDADAAMLADLAGQIAQQVVAALAPMLDMEKKMSGYVNEMKTMLGGMGAQKDDTAARLAALDASVKELRGDMPSAVVAQAARQYGVRIDQARAEALKADGGGESHSRTGDPLVDAAYSLIWGGA